MALTPKQERFVAEYLVDLNATQAAIRAGYSAKTAQEQGSRLLSNVMVAAAIKAKQVELAAKHDVTVERIIAELARIGFSDMRKLMTWGPDGVKLKSSDELSDDEALAIAEVSETTTKDGGSLKLKVHDKRAALVDLGKHLGMFVDRVKVERDPLDDLDAATLEAVRRAAAERIAQAGPGHGPEIVPPAAGNLPAVH